MYAAYLSYCESRRLPAVQRMSIRALGDNLVGRNGVARGQARTSKRERSLFGVKLRTDDKFLD